MRAALLASLLALAPVSALAQGEGDDSLIDARIRASAEAAENLQGPLDGAWTLVSAAGRPLYAFQIVDKPGGRDPLEGVWRDLRRPAVPGDIGMIDSLSRGLDFLVLTFSVKAGDPPVMVQLKSGPDGGWAGQLREAGVTITVKLRRG
jgi:hypothetical protein